MNRKALLIAAVIAVAGMFLLFLYLKRFENEKSGGERVTLLSLKKTVERGTVIGEDMLQERQVPFAYAEQRAVRAVDQKRIIGLKVAGKVQAQDTLMWSDIVTSGADQQDLSVVLSPGMRAATIKVEKENAILELYHPGDLVDVIAILGAPNSDTKTSVVLLQAVTVVAVGSQMSNDSLDKVDPRDTQNESSITLSVSLQEAQVFALAASQGRLGVVLRRRDDTGKVSRIPDINSDSLLSPKNRPVLVRGGSGPVEIQLNGAG